MKSIALIAFGFFAAGAGSAQAQELGRLFFSPEQRAALDERRKARVPDKAAAAPAAVLPVTRVDGVVRRSDGKSTVWVDGQTIPEDPRGDGARIRPRSPNPGSVSLPAGEDGGKRQDLRVGESLDRASGNVRDVVGEGEIKIGPRRAAPGK